MTWTLGDPLISATVTCLSLLLRRLRTHNARRTGHVLRPGSHSLLIRSWLRRCMCGGVCRSNNRSVEGLDLDLHCKLGKGKGKEAQHRHRVIDVVVLIFWFLELSQRTPRGFVVVLCVSTSLHRRIAVSQDRRIEASRHLVSWDASRCDRPGIIP